MISRIISKFQHKDSSELDLNEHEDEITETSPENTNNPSSKSEETKELDAKSERIEEGRSSPSNRSRKAEDLDEEEDDDEDYEVEEVEPLEDDENLQPIEDTFGTAFDLDHGRPLDEEEEDIPWRSSKVKTAKEFFKTELLYKYDILDDTQREPLKGSLSVELRGKDGGIWTVTFGDDLNIANVAEDSDATISMKHLDFVNLVNGDINPELAKVANKVKFLGNKELARKYYSFILPSRD